MLCDKGRSRLFYWCSFLKYWYIADLVDNKVWKQRNSWVYLFFFKPKKKHKDRGTICNIHLHSNFTGIYCIIMPCVLANSLTLSLLPGFDKKSVTLYIVNIHEKLGQMLRFWILYVFTVLRTEEKIGCRGIKKQRKKIKCYVRLSLLQMFYALNISKTVLRHYWLYRVSSLFFLTTLTHFNLIKKMKSMHE